MTSNGPASNEFWNQETVSNQVGQQNVHGDFHIHQVESKESLHLLDLLPNCPQAAFNAYHRRHDATCLPGTREAILNQIQTWADGYNDKYIYWLNGWAGIGKSTIARTVARRYHEKDRLGASFFFSRDQQDLRHAGRLFPSIAWQLAEKSASLRKIICKVIAKYRDIARRTLRDQWTQLVFQPLRTLEAKSPELPLTIVIDALDECENESDVREVIQLFAEAKGLGKGRLRVFMTSRQETPIRLGFIKIPEDCHCDFVLHNVSSTVINQDISIFFRHELNTLGFPEPWPSESDIGCLVTRARGLFIWAATACRFIKGGRRLASKRLSLILDRHDGKRGPEEELDQIYTKILFQSVSGEYDEEDREELFGMFRDVVGSIVILVDPLPAAVLARLLSKPPEEVDQTLNDLYAVLDVPKNQEKAIHSIHPSFHDFLLNKERCKDPQLWVDEYQRHYEVFVNCIELMSRALKRDLCNRRHPGARAAEVEEKERKEYLPPELRYACRHWVEHLRRSEKALADDDRVHSFLKMHLLHWLEALGWMQAASEGVLMMTVLQSLVTPDHDPELQGLISDARRFVFDNRWIIDEAPLQTYCSALVFAPQESLTRRLFGGEIPGWMSRRPQTRREWSSLQTLEGHTGEVTAVTFSPNGQVIASASDDKTVKLWDGATGALRGTLKGHTNRVIAVTFSPNGQVIASASSDNTVKLWKVETRKVVQEIFTDGYINELSFSADGSYLVTNRGRIKDQWITLDMQDVLWLPSEYRATCAAVCENRVVMGHASGQVSLTEIDVGGVFCEG